MGTEEARSERGYAGLDLEHRLSHMFLNVPIDPEHTVNVLMYELSLSLVLYMPPCVLRLTQKVILRSNLASCKAKVFFPSCRPNMEPSGGGDVLLTGVGYTWA
ncbi:hypothetical protein STEG23_027023 [Scotinomys teguina]